MKFQFRRDAKNASRDLAALTLLLSIPIVLLIIVLYIILAWDADSLNNPNNPHYIAPNLRTASSLSACLAPATKQIPAFQTTRLHMPMILPLRVGYLTSLHLYTRPGYQEEQTVWGIIPSSACTPNATALPSAHVNITHGAGALSYSYTTTKASTLAVTCYPTSRDAGSGLIGWNYRATWRATIRVSCEATTIWPGGDEEMATRTSVYLLKGSAGFANYVVMGAAVKTSAISVTEPAPLPTGTLAPASVITLSPEFTGDVKGMRPAGVEIWTEGGRTRTVYLPGRVQY